MKYFILLILLLSCNNLENNKNYQMPKEDSIFIYPSKEEIIDAAKFIKNNNYQRK